MNENFNDPEAAQYITQMGGQIGGAQDQMAQQLAKAKMLRAMGGAPQGRSVNNGRTFVASSPLEMLGSLGANYGAGKQEGMAAQSQESVRAMQTSQTQRMLDALIKMGAKPATPAQPPMMPPQMPPQQPNPNQVNMPPQADPMQMNQQAGGY